MKLALNFFKNGCHGQLMLPCTHGATVHQIYLKFSINAPSMVLFSKQQIFKFTRISLSDEGPSLEILDRILYFIYFDFSTVAAPWGEFNPRTIFQFVQIRGEKLGEWVTLLSKILICSL